MTTGLVGSEMCIRDSTHTHTHTHTYTGTHPSTLARKTTTTNTPNYRGSGIRFKPRENKRELTASTNTAGNATIIQQHTKDWRRRLSQ